MVQTAWKFAEAKKEKRSLNSYWCLQGRSHWSLSYEMFLLWAAVSEGEKVGGTSHPIWCQQHGYTHLFAPLLQIPAFYEPYYGFWRTSHWKEWGVLPRKTAQGCLPECWKKNESRATGQGAVRNGGGNANKKLLKEINATNTGEITSALWQWHQWFARVVKAHLPYFAK